MPTNTPEQFSKDILSPSLTDRELREKDDRSERMTDVLRHNGVYVRDAPATFPQHRANDQSQKDMPQ